MDERVAVVHAGGQEERDQALEAARDRIRSGMMEVNESVAKASPSQQSVVQCCSSGSATRLAIAAAVRGSEGSSREAKPLRCTTPTPLLLPP